MTKGSSVLSRYVALLVLALGAATLSAQSSCGDIPFELVSCFFAVGGGFRSYEHDMPQPQTQSPECITLYETYFESESGQYWTDVETAIAAGKPLLDEPGTYTTMVVFDIDETCLSNIPLYRATDYAPTKEDYTNYTASVKAPPILPTLNFYRDLIAKGYSVSFISERPESARNATIANLLKEGYGKQCVDIPASPGAICYVELIMIADDDYRAYTVFKSEARGKLKEAGFDLVASVGDQWSDLLGPDSPVTIVKMPNPLDYKP